MKLLMLSKNWRDMAATSWQCRSPFLWGTPGEKIVLGACAINLYALVRLIAVLNWDVDDGCLKFMLASYPRQYHKSIYHS